MPKNIQGAFANVSIHQPALEFGSGSIEWMTAMKVLWCEKYLRPARWKTSYELNKAEGNDCHLMHMQNKQTIILMSFLVIFVMVG